MNKRRLLYGIGTLVVLLIAVSVVLFIRDRQPEPEYSTGGSPTGGSGLTREGYLILRGYETPSNDKVGTPVGKFFVSNQQSDIHNYLESILYSKQPRSEYTGNILPGSVTIDNRNSVVQFKVAIDEPQVTYTVKYGTMTNNLEVLDEGGKVIPPVTN